MKRFLLIFCLLLFSCSTTITVVKDFDTSNIEYYLDSINSAGRNLSPLTYTVLASDETVDTIFFYTIYNKSKAVGTFRYEVSDSIYRVRIIDNDVKLKK